MKNLAVRALAGIALLAGCATGMAATMDITASFTPSMDNPENNAFTNTTPKSGYCAAWPQKCEAGQLSAALGGISLSGNGVLRASDKTPKNNFYLGLPVSTNVDVVNSRTGTHSSVRFNITHFSGRWRNLTGGAQDGWLNGSTFSYPSAGSTCGFSSAGMITGNGDIGSWYEWIWKVNGNNCFKINVMEERDVTPSSLSNIAIGYTLTTPNPLLLEAGDYVGSVVWTVGQNGDIDFGNMWTPSDSQLTINFTLSVTHELKLTATPEAQRVSLQPCAFGKVCTEDEGAANWERWMVTRITPELRGRSNFNLSSSGAFLVYLECEQQSGSDCALRSDNVPSQTVPVQTLLSLPNNIVDSSTGAGVEKGGWG